MLLLGVDKSDERASEWGDSTSSFRSDTIILARIDPPAQKVTLVSIPRDTMVDMGSHGEQKINAAYSFGGAAYMVEVVSEFAGVDISHYAEIDFEQFTTIVDTIGGIEVTLPVDVVDEQYANINLSAGTHQIDGATALALCRSRHAYASAGHPGGGSGGRTVLSAGSGRKNGFHRRQCDHQCGRYEGGPLRPDPGFRPLY